MTPEQRAELRKAAEEATPGPWYAGNDWLTADMTFESVLLQLNSTGSSADGFDLKYIAAANPATILSLLDYVESLERDAARYRWLRDQHWVESEATFRLCLSDVEYLNQYHDALDYAIDAAMGVTK